MFCVYRTSYELIQFLAKIAVRIKHTKRKSTSKSLCKQRCGNYEIFEASSLNISTFGMATRILDWETILTHRTHPKKGSQFGDTRWVKIIDV